MAESKNTKTTAEAAEATPADGPPKIVSSEGRCSHTNTKALVDKDGDPVADRGFVNRKCLDCDGLIHIG